MLKKAEVNFYKIRYDQFYKVLPRLIEGIVSKGNKLIILSDDDKQIQEVDNLLWTYAQLSFLPHATFKDEVKKENLVYITNLEADNANESNFIAILSDSYIPNDLNKYEKYLFFYNENTMQHTMEKVKKIIDLGGICSYISQDKDGQWVKSSNLL